MPPVKVKDYAHHDPRLRQAARMLKLSHECLGWRLIQIWSMATARKSPIISCALVGAALDKDSTAVQRALVVAGLATTAGEELDLSPMALLFECHWLPRKDSSDTRLTALRDKMIACLELEPHRREELCKTLHVRRSTTLAMVRTLLHEGIAVETEDGAITLAGTLDDTEMDGDSEDSGPFPALASEEPGVDFDDEFPEPETAPGASTEFPALLLSPRNSESVDGIERPGAESRADSTGPESALLDGSEIVPPARRRHIARSLWKYQNLRRAGIDANASSVTLNDAPGGQLDAIVLALARYSPAQCRHALDRFAAEGVAVTRRGGDGLKYLDGTTNWKAEQLDRAVGTAAEAENSYAHQ